MLPLLRLVSWSLVFSFAAALPAVGDTVLIQSGIDTAPYSFLPNLVRGNNAAIYAFQSVSDDGTNHDFETYVRFDVSAADIPPGQVLTEASLVTTYAFDFSGFGETSNEPGVIDCREVLEPWSDTTLTWNNRPVSDLPFDTITQIDSFGALICDATAVVEGWIYGLAPNHGFAMTSATARVIGMHSFEADVSPSLQPTLILTTEVPEPGFAMGLASGLLLLGTLSRRRAGSGRTARVAATRRLL